eukprot:m.93360 g.93360  ORF g.93360 m.93360 type:complete len:136 (+) comp21777_c0_seq2:72-479(+)
MGVSEWKEPEEESNFVLVSFFVCASFTAPEVCNGEPYNSSTDVYSMGIVLYEIMSRKMPYENIPGNAWAVRQHVASGGRPRVPRGLPKVVSDLMTQCWAHQPEERPDMNKVVQVLEDAIDSPTSDEMLGLRFRPR